MTRKVSKATFRPLIFGEALFDHFPDGSRVLGGAPFNVAWHLRGFRANPLMLTAVGRDAEGEEILDRMARWGMDTSGVQIHPSRPTGRVTAHLGNGNPHYEIEARQAYDAIRAKELPPLPFLAEADVLYHGTLALREPASSASLEHLRRQIGLPTLVDVNLRAPWWTPEDVLDRLRETEWVKLNREEAELLGGFSASDPIRLEEAGNRFREEFSIHNLVITLGDEGALALTPEGAFSQAAVQVSEGVDSVGAGDAFAAVLLLGLHQGLDVAEVLRRASSFAADVCRIRGATTEDLDLYDRHLRRWQDVS
jgi:fructokinase